MNRIHNRPPRYQYRKEDVVEFVLDVFVYPGQDQEQVHRPLNRSRIVHDCII